MSLKYLTNPTERIPKLKRILEKKGFLKAIEVHNGLSGLIVNELKIEEASNFLEFDALWESSLTDSASKGLPDVELVSIDSRLFTTEQIARVTDKPIIFDGDTGGDISQFEYLIPRLENMGVSAIIIEDKVFPKRNSLDGESNQILEDPKKFAEKIKAGKDIQKSRDFMIIARLESLIAGKDVDDAIKRAEIYLNAGADGIMIHSKDKTPEKIIDFAKKYRKLPINIGFGKPLVSVPTTYNRIYDDELKELGFNIVIHANHNLRASYKAMEEVCKDILLNNRSSEADKLCVPVKDIFEKVGYTVLTKKDKLREKPIPIIMPAAGRDDLSLKLNIGKIPKILIDIKGKSLLERQIKRLTEIGLKDINIIIGDKSEMFNLPGANYIKNENWETTFVMHSLMLAKDKMKEGFIYMNPDMVLEKKLITDLINSEGDIVMVVDGSYKYHQHEVDKILDLIISKEINSTTNLREINKEDREVQKIGKRINILEATHEALSLVKFSKNGAKNFIEVYEDCLKNEKRNFQEAESIKKADFTDILQEMIYRGFKINFIETHKGWLELHNKKDYEIIKGYFNN
ncbi:phosphoenolpyruvate mutase [Candidatus Parvarchaeota archaeon]|nr:MAG: phosphoenolpyruvate mutase [Candidatus Parvarchaeota archaeon]